MTVMTFFDVFIVGLKQAIDTYRSTHCCSHNVACVCDHRVACNYMSRILLIQGFTLRIFRYTDTDLMFSTSPVFPKH